MNWDGFDRERFLTVQSSEYLTLSMDQFTNCLDELLRDSTGKAIPIDPAEFEYKFYPELNKTIRNSVNKQTRFVFRNGRLSEIPNVDQPLVTINF